MRFGLSGSGAAGQLKGYDNYMQRHQKRIADAQYIKEFDLRQARGTMIKSQLENEERDSGGVNKWEKVGRLRDLRHSADGQWNEMSQEQKEQTATKGTQDARSRSQKIVEKSQKKLKQWTSAALSLHRRTVTYFDALSQLVKQNFNSYELTENLFPQKKYNTRNVEGFATEICSDFSRLLKKFGDVDFTMVEVHTLGPNTICQSVKNVYKLAYPSTNGQDGSDMVGKNAYSLDKQLCNHGNGGLLVLLRGGGGEGKDNEQLFIVCNVVLNPCRCGVIPVGHKVQKDGTYEFDGMRAMTGEYIRKGLKILGDERGFAGGDQWFFNLAFASPKVEVSGRLRDATYVFKPSSFILRDLKTKQLRVRSTRAEKPTNQISDGVLGRSAATSSKNPYQIEKSIDQLRQNRTSAEWVLGERFFGSEDEPGINEEEPGTAQSIDEFMQMGGLESGEDLGGGIVTGMNVQSFDHQQQSEQRSKIEATVQSAFAWVKMSKKSTSRFPGHFLSVSLGGMAAEKYGLIGRAGPRMLGGFLRTANLHPGKQGRVKSTDNHEDIRGVADGLLAYGMVACFIALRIRQQPMQDLIKRVESAKYEAKHTLETIYPDETIPEALSDQFDEFTEWVYSICGEGERVDKYLDWAEESLGYCEALGEQMKKDEDDQYKSLENASSDLVVGMGEGEEEIELEV